MSVSKKGKVFITTIRNYQSCNCRANFLITVSKRGLHGTLVPFDRLAPSPLLFEEMMKAKKNNDEDSFQRGLQKFRGYRLRPGVQAGIQILRELLDLGQDITLSCYCEDLDKCHRKIVGEWFEQLEYEVVYVTSQVD